MARYTHVFSLNFKVESDNNEMDVEDAEVLEALNKRVAWVNEKPGNVYTACGIPDDTTDHEEDDEDDDEQHEAE